MQTILKTLFVGAILAIGTGAALADPAGTHAGGGKYEDVSVYDRQ